MNPIVQIHLDPPGLIGGSYGLTIAYPADAQSRADVVAKLSTPGLADSLIYDDAAYKAWKDASPEVQEENRLRGAVNDTQAELAALEARLSDAERNPLSIGPAFATDTSMREAMAKKLRHLKGKFSEAKRAAQAAQEGWVRGRKEVIKAQTEAKLAAIAKRLEPVLSSDFAQVFSLHSILAQIR